MKRTMVLAALMIAAVTALASAQGRWTDETEETVLSGTLRLTEGQRPLLVVGSEEYTLALHPALREDLEVSSGERVTVEGFVVERESADLLSTLQVVRVRAIEADGTRHVLVPAGRRGSRGPGRGGWGMHRGMEDRWGMGSAEPMGYAPGGGRAWGEDGREWSGPDGRPRF